MHTGQLIVFLQKVQMTVLDQDIVNDMEYDNEPKFSYCYYSVNKNNRVTNIPLYHGDGCDEFLFDFCQSVLRESAKANITNFGIVKINDSCGSGQDVWVDVGIDWDFPSLVKTVNEIIRLFNFDISVESAVNTPNPNEFFFRLWK